MVTHPDMLSQQVRQRVERLTREAAHERSRRSKPDDASPALRRGHTAALAPRLSRT